MGARDRGKLRALTPNKGPEELQEYPDMDLKAEAAAVTTSCNDNNQGKLGRGSSIPMLQNESQGQISHLAIDIGGDSCNFPLFLSLSLPHFNFSESLCRFRNMNFSILSSRGPVWKTSIHLLLCDASYESQFDRIT